MFYSTSAHRYLVWITVFTVLLGMLTSPANATSEEPVKRIATKALKIVAGQSEGEMPLETSLDLDVAHPDVVRVVVVIHGKHRNVEGYFEAIKRGALKADARHETLIIAPQFLNVIDTSAHHAKADVFRWKNGDWSAGENAEGPVPVSSFDVIDQLLRILLNNEQFPRLRQVVLVGHSGGGQFVQRYAVIGRAPAEVRKKSIALRFVVANPSSYFYFTDERPGPDGTLAPYSGDACKSFNRWRYGPRKAPAYAGTDSITTLEASYFSNDMIYLLGTADTDPNHPDLDTSCAGEAQGPTRLERGKAFFRYAQLRHSDLSTQRFWLVSGVGHDDAKMFNSECGLAAIFDVGVCKTPLQ